MAKRNVKRVVEWESSVPASECREIESRVVRFYLATGDYIEICEGVRGGIEVRGAESVEVLPHADNHLSIRIRD